MWYTIKMRRRGQELKNRLREIIEDAERRDRRGLRRQSIASHDVECGSVFHHPSAFRYEGIRVADRVHSSVVIKSCPELCIDTVNDLKRRNVFHSRAGFVRMAELSVIHDSSGNVAGTVGLHGPHPYTAPNEFIHRHVTRNRNQMGLPIAHLHNGKISHIPMFVNIRIMRLNRWDSFLNEPGFTSSTRLTKSEYPKLFAALERSALEPTLTLDDTNVEIPRFGIRGWIDWKGYQWAMEVDSYDHAVAVVLTQNRDAILIDSNDTRPQSVSIILHEWMKSLGFTYKVANIPSMNYQDTKLVRAVLAQLHIDTPMTIGGYCASLTLCYLVDSMCTHKYDDQHLIRFFRDIVPPDSSELVSKMCILLYARAITNDCLKACIVRLRHGLSPPHTWPSSVPIDKDHRTRTVTWRDVQIATAKVAHDPQFRSREIGR